ncbi:MAG: M23 family metallopeptidase [Desulfovibrionaceae bacterium]
MRSTRIVWVVGLLAAMLLAVADPGQTRMGGVMGKKTGKPAGDAATSAPVPVDEHGQPVDEADMGAFMPMRADLTHMRAKGFVATGLRPVFPDGVDCPPVNCSFGASTRGDGSPRSMRFFRGLHGGMDIPVPEDTPILAMADGTVAHLSPGMAIGGIGVVLRHAPEDTGLPVWTYTEYKHLRELPPLRVGQRVRMGEVVAIAGDTGTAGGYYGEEGHLHLHLDAFQSDTDAFHVAGVVIPEHGAWLDPLALFHGPPLDSSSLRDLPDRTKRVPVACMLPDGTVRPAGARVIWPFACTPR